MCLYVIVALLIILTITGAYLSYLIMTINNDVSKIIILRSEVNHLDSKYQELNQLLIYMLRTNYINLTKFYKSIVYPVAYVVPGNGINESAVFLNITNPTNEPMNITIKVYVEPPITRITMPLYTTVVLVPPNTTIQYPVMLMLFNSSFGFFESPTLSAPLYRVPSMSKLKILVMVNFTDLELPSVTYNVSVTKVLLMHQPIGFAMYFPSLFGWHSRSIVMDFVNPYPNSIIINGYELYSYNGTLLTRCVLNPPIIDNATSITATLGMPTYTAISFNSSPYIQAWGLIQMPEVTFSTNCAINYTFPANLVQMPYGYMILNTNIGNITIPLVVNQDWWRWAHH